MKLFFVSAIFFLVSSIAYSEQKTSTSFGETVTNNNITALEIEAAQRAWGAALIQISADYKKHGFAKAKKTAEKALDTAYGYNFAPVLFKPTLTSGEQVFRPTREGALAYFVGGNPKYPNDKGFAIKGWVKYDFLNNAVLIDGGMGLTMGKVFFTAEDGSITSVDKTWGFKKDEKGQLRIVLHHSSLPYFPPAK